jgi:glycosyltransferase involved in cell wall biosynthesis
MAKILFLSGWYPTDENPSYGIFVRRHAQAAALSNTVSVLYVHTVSLNERSIIRFKTTEENNLFEIKISINKRQLLFGLAPLQKAYYFIWALIAGYYAVKKHSGRPDLVHANILYEGGRQALVLKFLFGIPFVCTEHWTGYQPEDGSYKGFFKKMVSGMVAARAKFILPVTRHLAHAMQSHKLKGNYKVIPNTINTKVFSTANKERLRQFVHISSLDERQKNFSGIVNAFRTVYTAHPEIKLVVAGGGSNIAAAKELVSPSGIDKDKIIFAGNKDETEIASLLSQSISLVLFSNYENQPCVILESLACGTPVIATHVGGVGEIINGQNGILVSPQAENTLAAGMLMMLEKKNTFVPQQLSEKIKEQYSFETVGNLLNKVYASALSKR